MSGDSETPTTERPECWCWTCDAAWREQQTGLAMLPSRFIVCPACGNKRCPRATHHDNACTGSNEPNQAGSRYQYGVPGSGSDPTDDDFGFPDPWGQRADFERSINERIDARERNP